ncbi:MAG: type III-B CRISPR module-associated protein Cmr5 [Bacteroidales bacterium]|jgi:CRISPR-associated protein Cmr5|nr:type III-B CRISPR module-associated protein Cmr5 [Acholeplasmataceae bacterium]MDD3702421.1 type III-B CRISPR module-associated protein Cmr5 [Bacteroidales bacterium]
MKTIEKILPIAIEAVENHVLVSPDNNEPGKVPKEFNGYISSFGASIIMSGLLPTIVFFSQKGRSKGDRNSVISAIEEIINEQNLDILTSNNSLLKTVKDNVNNRAKTERLQNKIQEAAIALKLAIRIFPKSQKESQ